MNKCPVCKKGKEREWSILCDACNKEADAEVDGIYCRECGAQITTGYSWEGYCVVCAEKHIGEEQHDRDK